jgi:hypothetical protein
MKEYIKHNGYSLSNSWFEWCRDNRETNSIGLSSLVYWINEKANQLNYPKSFGLPTNEAMHVLAIGSYATYKKLLNTLYEIGYIDILEYSKNQYTSNVIAISNFNKASTKQVQSTGEAYIKALKKQEDYNKLKELKELKELSKPKIKVIVYPSFDEFKEYALEKEKELDFKIDLDRLKTKFLAWSGNDWKNAYDKKIKNWKSTLTNGLINLKSDNKAGDNTNVNRPKPTTPTEKRKFRY